LFLDNLVQLSRALDGAFVQLERLDATLAATHAAMLDVQVLLQRLEVQGQASSTELVALVSEVLRLLQQQNMQHGAVQPHHSCSIHNEAERRLVKELLARYRGLPAEQQTQLPALLNGLGKLQLGSTDFEIAQEQFREAARTCTAAAGAAEAHFNTYRAALEQRRWDEALAEISDAARLDPRRFAPFPLDRYQPQRILGAGGFGTAFLCRDTKWEDEQVVIKTLHAANLDREGDSVFQEAKILRRLKHPAIIGVHDFGWADPEGKAQPYLVMDYFPGVNLDAFVRENGPLSTEALLSVAGQVARGLQAVHAQKVWHRDLKPANVLVQPEGQTWQVKVIDFGLALRRQTIETSLGDRTPAQSILGSSVAGTLLYAPPEQMGQRPDVPLGPYSDVYAFGKTCCYALFQTTEPKRRHWDKISAELADLLDRCTDQDVRHRVQSFDEVLEVLAGLEAKWAAADQAQREEERRQEESRKRLAEEEAERQRQELLRLRQEGEDQLEQFVYQAFERTEGRPTTADTATANRISKEHRLPSERAQVVVNKARARWQAECERRQKEAEEKQREHRQTPPEIVNSLGMKFVWVQPGTFLMGSPPNEEGRLDNQGPQHRVTLTKGFWVSVYPVTQSEWQKIMGSNPSLFKGNNRPVERVSWDDCQAFCRKLSEREGKTYRLLTEAEFEYVCRAGTTTAFCFGDEPAKLGEYAWFGGNSGRKSHPVGRKKANAWGLYDMHGNVWEWCQDKVAHYPRSDQVDPQGPPRGSYGVLRGGSWGNVARCCRSAHRFRLEPGIRNSYLGCRVACDT
jgi:formylglycine-generating enzyme required for sulfatase activity/tRNA A-37 threonylcarbamoyl transferase component Bud32